MDKLICVGKNYLEHAKEFPGEAIPEKPVLFLKPPSTIVKAAHFGDRVRVTLPIGRGAVHHECEIVVRLGPGLKPDAVTLGLDLTLREVQADLKKKGHPWELAKVFDGSAVLGPWIPLSDDALEFLDWEFEFLVDGLTKQKSRGREMRL
ncbi:MAG: fumarylacetoacetate hydrolase family protein, partial [Bdellovibrionota bacterium]